MAAVMKPIFPNLVVANGLDAGALSRDAEIGRIYQQDPLVHDKVSVRLANYMMDMGR